MAHNQKDDHDRLISVRDNLERVIGKNISALSGKVEHGDLRWSKLKVKTKRSRGNGLPSNSLMRADRVTIPIALDGTSKGWNSS